MSIARSLLPEYDHEMANTRNCLARIPEDQLAWRAHEKSWDLRGVATHMANLPKWTIMTLTDDGFDMAPEGGEAPTEEPIASAAQALELFDRNVAAARDAIAGAEDSTLMAPWTLRQAGAVVFTMPKIGVLRSFIMNHMIHHRAQLTVYLRLLDLPVPALYGPSADEAM